jgi:hypothetical protein
MANEWRKTTDEIKAKAEVHAIQAAIVFSFFSIITWVWNKLLLLFGFNFFFK